LQRSQILRSVLAAAAPDARRGISLANGWSILSAAGSPATGSTPGISSISSLTFALGIAFQYSAIARRGLGFKDGFIAAVKADTVSIIAFEIGLFAWMAVTGFVLIPHENTDTGNHWLMMQIDMIIGFFTSCPANWLLLRQGLKEAM
jgi:hypothetical protein